MTQGSSTLPHNLIYLGDWDKIYDKIFESYPEVAGFDWNKVGDHRTFMKIAILQLLLKDP